MIPALLTLLSLSSPCLCGDISSSATTAQIRSDSATTWLPTGLYYIVDHPTGFHRQVENAVDAYDLLPTPIVTVERFASIVLERSDVRDGEVLSVQLDAQGTLAFSRATGAWLERKIGIVVDNRLLMAPVVRSRIPGGMFMITGSGLTHADLVEMKAKLEGGGGK